MNARALWSSVSGLFIATMIGLAAGAVWMVAMLYMRHPLPWLALPVGAALGWAIPRGIRPAGTAAAIMASGATVLAAAYMSMLLAAANVAANLGLGLIDALRTAGPGMLWELARMAATPRTLAWFTGGAALAAVIALRPAPHR